MSNNRLFLGFETAFHIWRTTGLLGADLLSPTRVRTLTGGAPNALKIDSFRLRHPDLAVREIDVLVQRDDFRKTPGIRNHICSAPFPERSFYRLDDDVFVAAPELCLMQLASKLTVPETTKLAMELCGSFAVDVLFDDPGFCRRPAVTSTKKLKAYAAKLYRPNSRARPTSFLRWVSDAAASPREAALCMLLCMPPRFGGYGIELPQMNAKVELNVAEQFMSGKSCYICDLLWKTHNVAVEYDSMRYHTLQEKQEQDAVRRNMLEYKGIQVITATRAQLNSAAQFDKLAHQVAHAVGKRLRVPDKSHVSARSGLRKTLFAWDIDPRMYQADV